MLGYVLAGLSAMIWGLVYSIDQGILKKHSPAAIMLVYSIVGVTINSIVCGRKEFFQIIGDKKSLAFAAFTAVLSLIASRMTLTAVQTIGATRSSIMEITYPMFICFFCWLFYQETLDLKFVAGASLVLMGTMIIITR